MASGIRGINRLADVAKDARRAGGKPAVAAMRKALSAPAAPARRLIRESIKQRMPKRGGYADLVQRAIKVRIMTDTGLTSASVAIVTRARGKARLRDLPALDAGRLRHPPWGWRRSGWVTQAVPPDFWTDPMKEVEGAATANMVKVLDDMAAKLAGRQ